MKKGISVIALSVSIVLIVVIASVISLSLIENYKKAQKIEFAAELDMLRISSENYKLSNGYYPVLDETLDVSLIPDELKNTQFEGENTEGINSFNLLDYNLIGVDSLKYGTGETPNDRYVVSTKTGRIYYLKGLNIGNEIYYSMNPELKGLLTGNSPLEKNSDDEVIFKEDYANNQFKIIIYVPVKYTVNKVKFEEQDIVLDRMTESYYEYKLIPDKVGTINVDYSYNGKNKLVKHIIYDVDLVSDPTKNIYTLTFNSNGGVVAIENITKPEEYTVEMPTPKRTGYTFTGWYKNITGGDAITYTKMPNYSETLYAHWSVNTYILTYDVNGGDNISPTSKIVTYNSLYDTLPTPTRTGYSFIGWYTEKVGGEKISDDTVVENAKNHTIYAHWEEEYRTLTLDASGGLVLEQSTYTITKLIGESITLPAPVREGYSFAGWYTEKIDGTKVEYIKMPNETQTIYAHWDE